MALLSLVNVWERDQQAPTSTPDLQCLADKWGRLDPDLSLEQTRQMATWEAQHEQSEAFRKICLDIATTDPDATLEQVEEQACKHLERADPAYG